MTLLSVTAGCHGEHKRVPTSPCLAVLRHSWARSGMQLSCSSPIAPEMPLSQHISSHPTNIASSSKQHLQHPHSSYTSL